MIIYDLQTILTFFDLWETMQSLCKIEHYPSRQKWFEIIKVKASCYNLMLEILAYALCEYNNKILRSCSLRPRDKFLGASCIKEIGCCSGCCLSFLCFSLNSRRQNKWKRQHRVRCKHSFSHIWNYEKMKNKIISITPILAFSFLLIGSQNQFCYWSQPL